MILGIDPGASGGFAWLHNKRVESIKMPQSDSEIVDRLFYLRGLSCSDTPICFIEKVSGFIGKPQPGGAMFKFGKGFGFLLGAMMVMKFEINLVTPQKWQKNLGLGPRGERTPSEWKRHLKDEAQRLFPTQKVTLAVADSLLILKFAIKNQNENQNQNQK